MSNPNIYDMPLEEFQEYAQSSLDSMEDESGLSDSYSMGSEYNYETDLDELQEDQEEVDSQEELEPQEDGVSQPTELDPLEEESGNQDVDTNEDEDNLYDADSSIDYEAEYKKLIGKPIKANGKEITIDSMEDAERLIQMGANYYKQVSELKPAQRIISMLEQNQMLDESKLSFAIDLLNKDPKAIGKLVEESGIDIYELNVDSNDYTPKSYAVSDEQVNLKTTISTLQSEEHGLRALDVIGNQWDEQSRQYFRNNPSDMLVIKEHIANGVFDTVSKEVEKRKMLGTIPSELSDAQAYKFVGDSLYAQSNQQAVPNRSDQSMGQQQSGMNANVNSTIRKPSRDNVANKKRAGVQRRSPAKKITHTLEDIYSMSSEEFEKKYGNY